MVRLNGHPDIIASKAKEILGDKIKIDCSEYVRDFRDDEANLTGFGDAMVDIRKLIEDEEVTNDQTRIKILNAIVTATEKTME